MSNIILIYAFWEGARYRISNGFNIQTAKEYREAENTYCNGTDYRDGKWMFAETDQLVTCFIDNNTDETVYVWGDSHARHLVPGLAINLKEYSIGVMYYTGCPVASGTMDFSYKHIAGEQYTKGCIARNRNALDYFKGKKPSTILIHQYEYGHEQDQDWQEAESNVISQLTKFGHRVVYLGVVPRPMKNLRSCLQTPNFLLSETWFSKHCRGDPNAIASASRTNQNLSQLFEGIFYDPFDALCNGISHCITFKNRELVYRDKHHLTVEGSSILVSWLLEETDKLKPNEAGFYDTK